MADEDKDSKTEDPTEKKVSDALDKGDVPFSKEVTYVVTTLAITTIAIIYAPSFATEMTKVLRTVFARSLDWSLNSGEGRHGCGRFSGPCCWALPVAHNRTPYVFRSVVFTYPKRTENGFWTGFNRKSSVYHWPKV